MPPSSLEKRFQVLICIALVLICACHGSSGPSQAPGWLMGLPELMQKDEQQQQVTGPSVTGSILSNDMPHYHIGGQLLRPKSLSPLHAAQLAALQQLSPTHKQRQVSLSSVAKTYGISPEHLQDIMQLDPGLLVSKQGLLVWACNGQHHQWAHEHHEHGLDGVATATPVNRDDSLNDVDSRQQSEFSNVMLDSRFSSPGKQEDGPGVDVFTVAVSSLSAADTEATPQPAASQATSDVNAGFTASLQSIAAESSRFGHRQAALMHSQPGPQPQPQDAFKLHNRATGTFQHTIYLNFRGCTITGTYWNTATSKEVLQTDPYDLDGDPTRFSTKEKEAIVSIWQAVAQDFAAWAVDVTTEDPGEEALLRSNVEDTEYGMLVCVGGSSITTVGGLSGGLSFTGAWGQLGPGLQPVLVFPQQLGNGHPRAVADSISHEVGHTVGLAHFGGSGGAPYNDGHGPWGPLLGLPYGRLLSQWSRGPAVTGGLQDDLLLISQHLIRLTDDHGDTAATASVLCSHKQAAAVSVAPAKGSCKQRDTSGQAGQLQGPMMKALVRGTISDSNDQDWFSVEAGRAGLLHVQLQLPSNAGGYGVNNLLAAVQVVASDGSQVMAAATPQAGNEVLLQTSMQLERPGRYYVAVVPAAAAGVTSYGSIGDYLLSVSFPSVQATAPAASMAAVTADTHQLLHSGIASGCQKGRCASCDGCSLCDSGSALQQPCSCAASKGLIPKLAAAPDSQRSVPTTAVCRYQEVKAVGMSGAGCNVAVADTIVLLQYTISSPPKCFEGSILAAAPTAELLGRCPCGQPAQQGIHALPVPQPGSPLAADGRFACQAGVYAYGWRVPQVLGCYRVRIALADGSTVVTVLKVQGV